MRLPFWTTSCLGDLCLVPSATRRNRVAGGVPLSLGVGLAAFMTVCAAIPPGAVAQAPTTNVGTQSATQTATVTITTAGSLDNISVVTQGSAQLDFQSVNPNFGTCTVGTAYNVGDTCTVQYTFTPMRPWIRYGGISLSDGSGNLLGNLFLTGVGIGPQVSYPITTHTGITNLGNGFNSPSGIAVDASGNVYVADKANNAVKEIMAEAGVIPVNPTIKTLGSGFSSPSGVAVDGSGNVYVADTGNNAVKEIIAVGGAIPASPAIKELGSGFSSPQGIAVDGSGNVFVVEANGTGVIELIAINGVIPSSPTINTLGSGFASPWGVAVDSSGNVYVADTGNDAVKEMKAVGGAVPVNPTIVALDCLCMAPRGVSVDGTGNVYVADTGNNAVKEMMAVGGVVPVNPTITTLNNSFGSASGVAVDDSGNVYEAASSATAVGELNAQAAPTMSFPSTAVGDTSLGIATIANNGNAALIFAIPGSGSNPSVSNPFSINPSSTCPILTSASPNTGSLSAGSSCTEIVNFTPVVVGEFYGPLTLTDNNLNIAATTQSIPLLAPGIGTPAALTSPTSGSTLISPSTTFTWSPGTDATGYVLSLGSTIQGSYNLYYSGQLTATSVTANQLPTNGKAIFARLFTNFAGAWVRTDYIFYAATQAALTTPAPSSTLTGPTTTFTWTSATGATGYVLSLGSTGPGSYDLYYSGQLTATSTTAKELPTNGATIYARLFTNFNGTWVHADYTYSGATQAALTTPAPSSTLTGSTTTFTWTAAAGATGYVLSLGSTGPGSYDLFYSGQQTATAATAKHLPTNGETIYARLLTNYNGTWVHTDYTYTAGP